MAVGLNFYVFIFLEFSVVKDSTLRVTMTTSRYPLWKPKATDLSSKYSVYPLLEKKKKPIGKKHSLMEMG